MPAVAAEMLFRRGWLPQEPHAALVLAHGFGEHSARYEHVGHWLALRGFAVHAYDHLGHGRSTGRRGHVESLDQYLDDLGCMVERVSEEMEGLPLFVLGHSMGGLLAASFARERAPELAGLALSAPALGKPPNALRWKVWAAEQLRRLWPTARVPAGIDPAGLCSDPVVVRDYVADPLVQTHMSVSLACELFDAMDRTGPGGRDVALPLLVLHGDADPICPPAASEAFAGAAPLGRHVRYPGLRHEIFNEPSREAVLADLHGWLEEVLMDRSRAAEQAL